MIGQIDYDALSPSAPVLIRTYKKQAELEIWKIGKDGRYIHDEENIHLEPRPTNRFRGCFPDFVRAEPLEERRKRLARLLSRKTRAMRDGIQFSEGNHYGPLYFGGRAGMGLKASFSKHVNRCTVAARPQA